MARTSILLKDDLLLEVKRVAQTRGTTLTDIIQTALRAYLDAQPASALPSFTAVARPKTGAGTHLGRTAKKLAKHVVDPYEGSPREGRR